MHEEEEKVLNRAKVIDDIGILPYEAIHVKGLRNRSCVNDVERQSMRYDEKTKEANNFRQFGGSRAKPMSVGRVTGYIQRWCDCHSVTNCDYCCDYCGNFIDAL